jgi:hypothetical protein
VDANVDVAGGFAQRVARPLEVGHAAGCKLEVATFGGKRLRNCKSDAFTRSSDERALPFNPKSIDVLLQRTLMAALRFVGIKAAGRCMINRPGVLLT